MRRSCRLASVVAALLVAVLTAAAWPGAAAAATPVRWCGNDVVAGDRLPDVVAGAQVHVVYAVPSDGVDRFAELASPIATDIQAVVEWWRREDPTRMPRFDQFAFPSCAAAGGSLDLSFVRLRNPTSHYQGNTDRLARVADDVAAADAGLLHAYKKYLVYFDGVVDVGSCGTAFRGPTAGGGRALAAVWVRGPQCGGEVGFGGYAAGTAAHELIHQLGALPDGAPHPCADGGHPCDDPRDILYGLPAPYEFLHENVLDAGRDDYYGHSGSWWDVQDSAWLQRLDLPQHPLTVALSGAGQGDTVTSDLPGIGCPSACAVAWQAGTRVLLEVVEGDPEERRFRRWEGGCSGAESGCAVTVDAARTVTAVFGPTYHTIVVSVVGRGAVTTVGLSCTRRCAERFDAEDVVAFRARAAKGWRLAGWRGACSGKRGCSVEVTRDTALTAVFVRAKPKPRPKPKR